ncbi:hypothetical protein, partial [Hydrogeniiclostridium mannosilyticum]|uniref:hypothetical protein n=1 Tax=Hydrogeniiclostridium mannosilyticum TaxID=2764322 RepID=UPI001A9A4C84
TFVFKPHFRAFVLLFSRYTNVYSFAVFFSEVPPLPVRSLPLSQVKTLKLFTGSFSLFSLFNFQGPVCLKTRSPSAFHGFVKLLFFDRLSQGA